MMQGHGFAMSLQMCDASALQLLAGQPSDLFDV